jgi:nitrite reductase/ring-hydroxylating ferredoxin subunit
MQEGMMETAASLAGNREYVVCAFDDLKSGEMKIAPVGKFGVGVYNIEGALYALTNYCPHEGAPLCLGRVQGTNEAGSSAVERVRQVRAGEVLRCPWHGWEFDLKTGKSLADAKRGIRTYAAFLKEGNVVISR